MTLSSQLTVIGLSRGQIFDLVFLVLGLSRRVQRQTCAHGEQLAVDLRAEPAARVRALEVRVCFHGQQALFALQACEHTETTFLAIESASRRGDQVGWATGEILELHDTLRTDSVHKPSAWEQGLAEGVGVELVAVRTHVLHRRHHERYVVPFTRRFWSQARLRTWLLRRMKGVELGRGPLQPVVRQERLVCVLRLVCRLQAGACAGSLIVAA
jgi:hypothetical protein